MHQVVPYNSAVIPGQLNDALTTDHSGLNKFAVDSDPNLIKIQNVIKKMLNSLQQKKASITEHDLSNGISIQLCVKTC
jgi:hypothetical protein